MKIALGLLGLFMLVGGLADGCAARSMITSVAGEDGREIYNVGLIGKQQADATFDAALAIIGAVLFGSAAVVEAIHAHDRRLTVSGAEEKDERGLMLLALRKIADQNEGEKVGRAAQAARNLAPPAKRPATAAADPAFDAAIAAELKANSRLR
jgi:hypothetical protein